LLEILYFLKNTGKFPRNLPQENPYKKTYKENRRAGISHPGTAEFLDFIRFFSSHRHSRQEEVSLLISSS